MGEFFRGLISFLTSTRFLWGLTTVGLSATAVALFWLSRSRWGQSNSLRKCAILSLMVHVLLAAYASTVYVVSLGPGPGAGNEELNFELGDTGETWLKTEIVALDEPASAPANPGGNEESNSHESSSSAKAELENAAVNDDQENPAPSATEAIAKNPLDSQATKDVPANQVDESSAKQQAPGAENPHVAEQPLQAAESAEEESPPSKESPLTAMEMRDPASNKRANVDPSVSNALVPIKLGTGTSKRLANQASPDQSKSAAADLAESKAPSSKSNSSRLASDQDGGRLVPVPLQLRRAGDHTKIAQRRGGSKETEEAVQLALDWLADAQEKDGRWDASKYGAGKEVHVTGQDRDGAGKKADSGVTALAILAFLGAGHTHQEGEYQDTVRRGLDYLIRGQSSNGNLGGSAERFAVMYCHGMATFALCEALAMTGDPRLRRPAEEAVAYTLRCQHKSTGGWRYRPNDLGDTSQHGWQVMALKSAQLAEIQVPNGTWDLARRFIKTVAAGDQQGKASYRPGERPTVVMTAEALVCREMLGIADQTSTNEEAVEFILTELPGDGRDNFYYWYYATLGLYHLQGDAWNEWNSALTRRLLALQRQDGDLQGSWDPDGVWGNHGGRVFSTATGAMCLEVYYRYLPTVAQAFDARESTK